MELTADHRTVDLTLDALRELGVEGEVYAERSITTRISVHQGAVESQLERRVHGAGVRVFTEGRVALSFTSDLGPESLRRAVETARAIAHHTRQDEANVLPSIAPSLPPLINLDRALEAVSAAEKTEIAKEVERAARAESAKIQRTREAAYQDLRRVVVIANTRGERVAHEASRCFAWIELAATDGASSQTGSQVGWALGPSGLDPTAIGREAARRGVRKLGAKQPPTARTAVVLDPEATAGLFGALAPLFSADAVLKGKSLLGPLMGETIASSGVTLIDDGAIAGGCESAPVDGEGTPTGETVLLDRGVLKSFFHTVYSARRSGVAPTGNGVRGGYAGTPDASPTNLYLRPTGISREVLLGSVASGVYVTEMMGLHTVDTTTGDFSLGVSGMAIENGRLGQPLDRMAVSGNVIDLLKSIEAVATDLTFLVAGGGSTVLLRDISVSGARG